MVSRLFALQSHHAACHVMRVALHPLAGTNSDSDLAMYEQLAHNNQRFPHLVPKREQAASINTGQYLALHGPETFYEALNSKPRREEDERGMYVRRALDVDADLM